MLSTIRMVIPLASVHCLITIICPAGVLVILWLGTLVVLISWMDGVCPAACCRYGAPRLLTSCLSCTEPQHGQQHIIKISLIHDPDIPYPSRMMLRVAGPVIQQQLKHTLDSSYFVRVAATYHYIQRERTLVTVVIHKEHSKEEQWCTQLMCKKRPNNILTIHHRSSCKIMNFGTGQTFSRADHLNNRPFAFNYYRSQLWRIFTDPPLQKSFWFSIGTG